MKIAPALRAAAIVAALAPLGLAAPAFAQPAPPPQYQFAAPDVRAMSARVEARLSALHEELAITPGQEMLWWNFAQTVRANSETMESLFSTRHEQLPRMTAPENLRSLDSLAVAHQQGMDRLIAAFMPLYNAMSPEQQANADAVLRRHSQHMERKMMAPAARPRR